MKLTNIIKNVTPSVAVMVAGLLGAWLAYDNYFSDKVSAEQISTFEPAAGEDMAVPAAETVPMEAAPAVEGAVVEGAAAAVAAEVKCTMDATGAPVMNAEGTACVPAPEEVKCMMDAMGAPVMNAEGTACVPMPAEVVPAVEGAVEGSTPAAPVEAAPAAPEAPAAAH